MINPPHEVLEFRVSHEDDARWLLPLQANVRTLDQLLLPKE
mgnify:CR=1 FL=1